MSLAEIESTYFSQGNSQPHPLIDLQFQNLRIDGLLSANNFTGPSFDSTYILTNTLTGTNINVQNLNFNNGQMTGTNINVINMSVSTITGTNVNELNGNITNILSSVITGTSIFSNSLTSITGSFTNLVDSHILTLPTILGSNSGGPGIVNYSSSSVTISGAASVNGRIYASGQTTSTYTQPSLASIEAALPAGWNKQGNGYYCLLSNGNSGTLTMSNSADCQAQYTITILTLQSRMLYYERGASNWIVY